MIHAAESGGRAHSTAAYRAGKIRSIRSKCKRVDKWKKIGCNVGRKAASAGTRKTVTRVSRSTGAPPGAAFSCRCAARHPTLSGSRSRATKSSAWSSRAWRLTRSSKNKDSISKSKTRKSLFIARSSFPFRSAAATFSNSRVCAAMRTTTAVRWSRRRRDCVRNMPGRSTPCSSRCRNS